MSSVLTAHARNWSPRSSTRRASAEASGELPAFGETLSSSK
jgi:hypothetical protein